jgi:hypothetical protein
VDLWSQFVRPRALQTPRCMTAYVSALRVELSKSKKISRCTVEEICQLKARQ